MLTFFQEPFSHWCVKARKIMDYKKINYETKNVGYHDKRELIKVTSQDYVPAIVNDGQIVTYPDIPDFLEKVQPNPTIYPDRTKALAKAIENWAHYRLEEIVWRYVVPDFPKTFKDDLERWIFVEIQELRRRAPRTNGGSKTSFQVRDGCTLPTCRGYVERAPLSLG